MCRILCRIQGAIIRVLTYRRYANITVWYFFVFSQEYHVGGTLAIRVLTVLFAGTTWPFQTQGIQYCNLVGTSCVWDVLPWNMIGLMALRNVGVDCLYMHCVSFSTSWSEHTFQKHVLYNLILKTKYTFSTEFVPAQVRGNNHWRTSQARLKKSWIIAPWECWDTGWLH
jgi:hypothetical protein